MCREVRHELIRPVYKLRPKGFGTLRRIPGAQDAHDATTDVTEHGLEQVILTVEILVGTGLRDPDIDDELVIRDRSETLPREGPAREDSRLRNALDGARLFSLGERSVGQVRRLAFGCHAATRKARSPEATAVARAVGDAVAVAHMVGHSREIARYTTMALSGPLSTPNWRSSASRFPDPSSRMSTHPFSTSGSRSGTGCHHRGRSGLTVLRATAGRRRRRGTV